MDKTLQIGTHSFQSRLMVGTGKYKDFEETKSAITASGAEVVTVALRRTNLGQNKDEPNLLDFIDPNKWTILPNTAGCFNALKHPAVFGRMVHLFGSIKSSRLGSSLF